MTRGAGGPRIARPLLFLLPLLAALPAAASRAPRAAHEKAAAERLWETPEWRRLLHYKPAWGGGWRSDAVAGLFVSPVGRVDPRAELEASLEALYGASGDASARCRYPARMAWLAGRLGGLAADLEPAACSEYADWRELLAVRRATLVFASAYLNNPSSMFGHTFLQLERGPEGGDARLLDNTLNFAAETGDDGGAVFAAKGLLGLYPGVYTVAPYHMKIVTYGQIENRDLWEYELALSDEEVDRLAGHAWEMGRSTFPYYFLSKNCSYQLMPALEAAAPRLSLLPGSPPVVGPADTLRAVAETPGLIGRVRYRPSHATVMRQRRALLSPEERRAAEAYMRGRTEEGDRLSAGMPSARRALVLDSAQDYVLYAKGFSPDAPPETRALERTILVRRAKVPDPPADLAPPAWAAPPHEGHPRRRLMLGGGFRRGGAFGQLSWRPGYHDLLDRPRGFVPGAAIEAMSWRARRDGPSKSFHLQELKVLDILSVAPYDRWVRQPSWTVSTGLDTAWELGKEPQLSLVYEGRLGAGLAAEPLPGALVFALAQGEGAVGEALRRGFRVGGGLRGGLAADLGADWRLLLDGALSAFGAGDRTSAHRLRVGLNRALGRDAALRAEGLLRGRHRELGLNAVLYY